MPRYRWNNPQEWLLEKAQEKAAQDDSAWLLEALVSIVMTLDADTVQDHFQSEMEEDGYFEPIEDPVSNENVAP